MDRPAAEKKIEALIENVGEVGTLPKIYTKIDEALNSPDSTYDQISQLISMDSSLAARLLKIANSALYTHVVRIDTINRAMAIIGTRQLRDLVLATTVIQLFKNQPLRADYTELFWSHSIACGIACRVIAAYRREINIERYYVMGLLHDIGRLVMYIQMPEKMQEICTFADSEDSLLIDLERSQLGYDHAMVGKKLLKKWRLPLADQEAVGFHHQPAQANHHSNEAAIVHVGDIFANAMGTGSLKQSLIPHLDSSAWRLVGIDTSHLNNIIEQIDHQYADAISLFKGTSD